MPDGNTATCASEGTQFQPVKYLPFVPRHLAKMIEDGASLTDASLPYGGAYYINQKQEPIAFSGSVFCYNTRRQDYEYSTSSPLVIMAQELKKTRGFMQWGVPSTVTDKMLEARKENNARRTKIAGLAKSVMGMGPRRNGELNRVADALDKYRHKGSR